MNQVNRNKLKKLHDFVKNKVKDDWFNLTSWVSDIDNFKAKECGTTACLFGWAVVAFPDQLRWAQPEEVEEYDCEIISRNKKHGLMAEINLAAKFFGLTKHQACFLFGPTFYPMYKRSRQDALRRLKWFIEKAPEDFSIDEYRAGMSLIPRKSYYAKA